MKKSITKRIKITKEGKIMRRHMAISHFRIRKSSKQLRRKKPSQMYRGDVKAIKKFLT